jgi:uncharacterized alpha-E superfamily protein
MLSRVAENLYWIARYVERAEGLARLLEDAFSMELEAGTRTPGAVGPLDNVLLMLSAREAYRKAHPLPAGVEANGTGHGDTRDAILRFLTFDRGGGVSIRETVAVARENARGTQEALSGEAWSQLNKLHLFLNSRQAEARFAASPVGYLDRIRRECLLFAALVDGTLPRTEGFHFIQVGRYLERVDVLSRVINVHCYATGAFLPAGGGSAAEVTFSAAHWASLLRGTSAYEGYLKQAGERIDPVGVVGYLLLEAEFPRSMRFAVARCLESLRCIAGGGYGTDAERHLGKLDSELRYMDVDDLFHRGVDQFLVGVQDACAAVAKDVHTAYFRT